MKGPGLRIDLDVRRLWRCPVCHTERHTPGRVTSIPCHFCQDHPPMTLVEPQRADRRPIPPPDMLIDLHPDDVDAPAFVPVHLREPEEQPVEAAGNGAPDASSPAEEPAPAGHASTLPANAETSSATADNSTDETAEEPVKTPRRKKSRRKKRRGRKQGGESPSPPSGGSP